jgi:hypothetical protein
MLELLAPPKSIRNAGQNQPGDLSRLISPRPQLLRDSTKESILLLKPKPSDDGCVAATRGLVADAFFGASPVVASALGIRLGATPRGRFHSKPSPSALPHKEDISTLLGIGHFYLALTWAMCFAVAAK